MVCIWILRIQAMPLAVPPEIEVMSYIRRPSKYKPYFLWLVFGQRAPNRSTGGGYALYLENPNISDIFLILRHRLPVGVAQRTRPMIFMPTMAGSHPVEVLLFVIARLGGHYVTIARWCAIQKVRKLLKKP
jgi:hypothetical protein